jgi:hypothetical protein
MSEIVEIYTRLDLIKIHSMVLEKQSEDVIFKIMNDIDLENIEWFPIGFKKEDSHISHVCFCGEIQGQNHIVKNMYVSISEDMLGFVCINKGIIRDLYFDNTCYIDSNDVLGTVCGVNSGQIINCKSSANIDGGSFIGGICGLNTGKATVKNCSFFGQINGFADLKGIVGSSKGIIENSVCRGVIKSERDALKVGGQI